MALAHSVLALFLAAVSGEHGQLRSIFELPNCQGTIEQRDDLPSAAEFATAYQDSDSGFGKPVLFKGAAKHMGAMQRWRTDAEVVEQFGDEVLRTVEFAKKETRTAGSGQMNIREFVARYNTSELYTVSPVPGPMRRDVELLPFLSCSYGTSYLDLHNIWWGSDGVKSVIHNDDQDNVNCLFSGRKRMIFWHPKAKPTIESNRCGWVDADVERRERDPQYKAYGAFGGRVDVDSVDLERFPGFAELDWFDATMEPGDCLFIPTAWYHQVLSTGRTMAANVWWWRRDSRQEGDFEQCPEGALALDGCEYGYEGPEPGQRPRTTHCRGKPAPKGRDLQHAGSRVTEFQRTPTSIDCNGGCPLRDASFPRAAGGGAVGAEAAEEDEGGDDERRGGNDDDEEEDGGRDEL
eukprot:g7177.t1